MPTNRDRSTRAEGQPTGGPTPPDVPNGNPAKRGAQRRLARPVAWRRRESFRSRSPLPNPRGASCARRTTAAPPRPLAAGAGGAPRETQEA